MLCENVSGGQRILETLNFQKHIGNNYDAVLNATYFIKIRELSAALSSEYKNIAGISVDAVMSLAQAALAVLSHFHAALKRAPDSEVGSSLALCGSDISLLCNLVRKSSN